MSRSSQQDTSNSDASSRVATPSIPNPTHALSRCPGQELAVRASSAPPRLLRASAPLALALDYSGAPDRVQSSLQKAATCRPATCAVHLPTPSISARQSFPGQRRWVASSSSPAQSRRRPSQITRVFSPVWTFATPITYPICPGNLKTQNHLAPTPWPASFLLTRFPNSSSIESKPPAQLNNHAASAEHHTHLP